LQRIRLVRKKEADPFSLDHILCWCVIAVIRTQISLSEEQYEAAKEEARRRGISRAELLRRSLRTMLPIDETKPWMRLAGMVESGDSSSSQRIDEVVHGRKDRSLRRYLGPDRIRGPFRLLSRLELTGR